MKLRQKTATLVSVVGLFMLGTLAIGNQQLQSAISGEERHLSARVPEQYSLVLDEFLLSHVGDEGGHRLRRVGGIEKDRFGPRRDVDGFP